MRLRNRRGQFIPMSFMLLVSAFLMFTVVLDGYRVAHAKLQAQNMADAAALAIAAMEAKNINVILDRNEWLNHLYQDSQLKPDGTRKNDHQLPGISEAARVDKLVDMERDKANIYAQMIATVNQAQSMFKDAYNQFLGAGGGTVGQNAGPGSLADILAEIQGLNDPQSPVRIIAYNNQAGQSAAEGQAQQIVKQGPAGFSNTDLISTPVPMAPVNFTTEDVKINLNKESNKKVSLTDLYYNGSPPQGSDGNPVKVGWLRPKWDDAQSTLQINSHPQIGAGVIVIKQVNLWSPFVKHIFVQAKAMAYVVQTSGRDIDPTSPDPSHPRPPSHFRPTYYVQLGYK